METLTLEQAYYIGELIAAFVVIISVVYLALQVRQNTQTLRLNAQHDASSEFVQWQQLLAQNGELMEIVMRSETEPESLNELERRRAWAVVDSVIELVSTNYYRFQNGVLPDYQWNPIARDFPHFMELPIYQEFWAARKHSYPDKFQVFINQLIKEGATS